MSEAWQTVLSLAAGVGIAWWADRAERRRPWIGVLTSAVFALILLGAAAVDLVNGKPGWRDVLFALLGGACTWWAWHQWQRWRSP